MAHRGTERGRRLKLNAMIRSERLSLSVVTIGVKIHFAAAAW
jgi:hypothetical protein